MAARGGRRRRGEAAEEQGRMWAVKSDPERKEGERAGHGCDFGGNVAGEIRNVVVVVVVVVVVAEWTRKFHVTR